MNSPFLRQLCVAVTAGHWAAPLGQKGALLKWISIVLVGEKESTSHPLHSWDVLVAEDGQRTIKYTEERPRRPEMHNLYTSGFLVNKVQHDIWCLFFIFC